MMNRTRAITESVSDLFIGFAAKGMAYYFLFSTGQSVVEALLQDCRGKRVHKCVHFMAIKSACYGWESTSWFCQRLITT
jgi:hypothetical protein